MKNYTTKDVFEGTNEQSIQFQLLEDWIQDELKIFKLYFKYQYSFVEEDFEGVELDKFTLYISVPNFKRLLDEDKRQIIYDELQRILLCIIHEEYFKEKENK